STKEALTLMTERRLSSWLLLFGRIAWGSQFDRFRGNNSGKEMVCEMLAWVFWIKSEPNSTPPRRVDELSTDSLNVLRLRRPRFRLIPKRLVAVTISLVLRATSKSPLTKYFLFGYSLSV